eukprot:COSAG04_NODE_2192_length_4564_cov_4.871669_5_plen_74_part_00
MARHSGRVCSMAPTPSSPKPSSIGAASRRASSCVPGRKHSAPLAAVALSREIQSIVASADQYGSIWLSVQPRL